MKWTAKGIAVAVALLAATPAGAQSVLAAGGLGVPVDPVDARTRALGVAGPGLTGAGVAANDPAAAADLRIPTITFTGQSSWLDVEQAGATGSAAGARFPSLGAAYPVRDWGTVTLTFAGVLDQRWKLERTRSLPVGIDGAPVSVVDLFESEGGVSAVRLGFAHRVSPSLAVGASVGSLIGNVSRAFRRSFDSLDVGVPVPPFESGGQWSYSGLVATAGAIVDVADVVRAGASVSWASELDAEPVAGSLGAPRSYAMPLQLRAGVSATLAPGLFVVGSAARADWSATREDLGDGTAAGASVSLGAGLEWEGASLFGRTLPLRFGWHRADLPFGIDGEAPTESALSGGIGLVLARAGTFPLALVDLAVERGGRTAGALSEDFWRSTFTVRVAGF